MSDKIILITQYYIVKKDDLEYCMKRQEEVKYCLIKNAENPFLDEIHLLVEEIYNLDFIPEKFLNKIKQINVNKRITYTDVFKYYNENIPNQICMLANADIYTNSSLQILKHINYDFKPFLALNRYEDNESTLAFAQNGIQMDNCRNLKCTYIDSFAPSIWSQDAWVWKSEKIDIPDDADFLIGSVGCDNYIAYLLSKQNYIVFNPSNLVCVNHLDRLSIKKDEFGISKGHVSKKREEKVKDFSKYLFVKNLAEIPDKYTTSINMETPDFKNKFVTTVNIEKSITYIFVEENQITYSSSESNGNIMFDLFPEVHNKNMDYWDPLENDATPFVQFDFDTEYNLAVIDIAGKPISNDNLDFGYVTSYKISYMTPDGNWVDDPTIFDGIDIQNGNYVKRNYLDTPITCTKLKIYPLKFVGIRALKVRLFSL